MLDSLFHKQIKDLLKKKYSPELMIWTVADIPPSKRTVLCVTESQNHRMFRVVRDLCWSSSPIPLPKQGRLQQAASGSRMTLGGGQGRNPSA